MVGTYSVLQVSHGLDLQCASAFKCLMVGTYGVLQVSHGWEAHSKRVSTGSRHLILQVFRSYSKAVCVSTIHTEKKFLKIKKI